MRKMQMAHAMALELVKIKPSLSAWQIADRCFEYADAMQAEADKREDKIRPEVLEEWKPDWGQAPEWAAYWIKTSGGSSAWLEAKPRISSVSDSWVLESIKKSMAPSFGYQGNWQGSLRKRPQ